MKKTKFIGITAAALMMVSGVAPGFSSGLFSADNTAVTVSAAYISSGSVGGKFSCYIDSNTFLYLSVTDSVNKKAAVIGSGLSKEKTYISIPEKVTFQGVTYEITEIADNAFKGQTNLSYVSGMKNVTKIGKNAFYGCTSLEYVSVNPINKSGKNNLKTIGDNAFYNCTSLYSVSINDVNTIGKSAFYNCNSLEYIYMMNIQNLGESAFENCWNIYELYLKGATIRDIPKNAFKGCTFIQRLTLPDDLKTIGESAFEGCKYLKELNLPGSLERIYKCAFRYCRELRSVTIPYSVYEVCDSAFYACDAMTEIAFLNRNTGIGNQAAGYDDNRFYKGPKSNFTIYGQSNSNAMRYAEANGFKFIQIK